MIIVNVNVMVGYRSRSVLILISVCVVWIVFGI